MGSRTQFIDDAVEGAVRGKPIWERAGMTREEYEQGKRQQAAELERKRQNQTSNKANGHG